MNTLPPQIHIGTKLLNGMIGFVLNTNKIIILKFIIIIYTINELWKLLWYTYLTPLNLGY